MGMGSTPNKNVMQRAEQRRQIAYHILNELSLLERWRAFGRPVVVGAVAYNLVVSPDIDCEIYCPVLRIDDGFQVLNACACHPSVTKAYFSNHLNKPDKALYWQLHYRYTNDEIWKIDMWSAHEDYNLPRSEDIVVPMQKVLTPASREIILTLKEWRHANPAFECPSIDLYRAVLEGGVRTEEELQRWIANHPPGGLTAWRPSIS
jgi:hypothetical protein